MFRRISRIQTNFVIIINSNINEYFCCVLYTFIVYKKYINIEKYILFSSLYCLITLFFSTCLQDVGVCATLSSTNASSSFMYCIYTLLLYIHYIGISLFHIYFYSTISLLWFVFIIIFGFITQPAGLLHVYVYSCSRISLLLHDSMGLLK